MKVKKEYTFVIFTVVSISGPVFGVVFGGFVSSKLGGYNTAKSLYVVTLMCVLCAGSAFPIPFLKQ